MKTLRLLSGTVVVPLLVLACSTSRNEPQSSTASADAGKPASSSDANFDAALKASTARLENGDQKGACTTLAGAFNLAVKGGAANANTAAQKQQVMSKARDAQCFTLVERTMNDIKASGGLPPGTSPSITATIAWWDGLSDGERDSLTGKKLIAEHQFSERAAAVGGAVGRANEAAQFVGALTDTLQFGDRGTPRLRAEQRADAVNEAHQFEDRAAFEGANDHIVGDVRTFPLTNDKSLDY